MRQFHCVICHLPLELMSLKGAMIKIPTRTAYIESVT